ncbi:MAG TPA: hypothetical protein DCE00_03855 [Firmicutes bacterium]|nr:hypothetical protein [Bacillota bacterium]
MGTYYLNSDIIEANKYRKAAFSGIRKGSIMHLFRYFFVRLLWKTIDLFCYALVSRTGLVHGVTMHSDLPYRKEANPKQCLDVYYPEDVSAFLPILVYIHGGGAVGGDKLHYRHYCMQWAREGYVVFNVNYSLAPQPSEVTQLNDILAALDWISNNHHRYHGDGEKIVLAGDSAGAYLAALAANVCTNPQHARRLGVKPTLPAHKLKGVMLLCGLYDLESAAACKFPGVRSLIELVLGVNDLRSYDDFANLSVTRNLSASYPPTFISSGEVDWFYEESITFIKALSQRQVPVTSLLFPRNERKAFHGFPFLPHLPTAKLCRRKAGEFLREVCK